MVSRRQSDLVDAQRDRFAGNQRHLEMPGHTHTFAAPVQEGRIANLDRHGRWVEVEGLSHVQIGDRLIVNPSGRGRNYRVEEIEDEGGALRLRLDVTSLLGRGRVRAIDGRRVDLEFGLMTRTGYLHGARAERESDGSWAAITSGFGLEGGDTAVELDAALSALRPGDWLSAVDYVVGDPVRYEPVRKG